MGSDRQVLPAFVEAAVPSPWGEGQGEGGRENKFKDFNARGKRLKRLGFSLDSGHPAEAGG